ncbi:2-oxo-4-hydroxy-4-carboxy-5-ureidoimidazoline decarboxylase [Roseibium litorale]|uniref:2-oxo-4-hydroxy-4-carboxy-5-ureidoimidazoline decarboxylase n=1 Tax=Roseibium litorale TaxID=2803841 RepID=A0ABR9CJ25_9HYPH|nr:2-oxo-4-hydroxy-4-carboxy-5-ureidoimidazoline decarboxylase [Roseibium litorale]MBD8890840.1 2-oxo-4-hydroxy-4-carboxy-5-ureidoimidazoline decarboxylase [Roseibium litorale]
MISLETVNAMTTEDFVAAFGDVAEHSPWVARAAHGFAPFANRAALVAAFESAMRNASHADQLALIRAHPDLAGKAALAGEVAEDSRKEQAGAGLDRLSAEEFSRFTELNGSYLGKFGFPFIFAVKGADKHMILDAFEDRLENTPEIEFGTALVQISKIFRFRLEDRISE